MEPFIGQIMLFAGTFAPRGWAFCDGQILSIPQFSALFSILGTTYGGDGKITFKLPDLRGRFPIHTGNGPGPGLSPRKSGSQGGVEQVKLTTEQMPTHVHGLRCLAGTGDQATPQNNFPSGSRSGAAESYATTQDSTMNRDALTSSGDGAAHDNMPPFLGINYIIAMTGSFPSRN